MDFKVWNCLDNCKPQNDGNLERPVFAGMTDLDVIASNRAIRGLFEGLLHFVRNDVNDINDII